MCVGVMEKEKHKERGLGRETEKGRQTVKKMTTERDAGLGEKRALLKRRVEKVPL